MTTIRDVASKAEVSIATVSRVVNGNRPVHPDIRERVLKAIEELDYRPNYLARGLRQRNTSMIGLIIPDNSNPFYAELARAIEDAGFAAGYIVILCNSDLSEEKQQAYIDVLLSHKVDGMILVNIESPVPKALGRILAEHIPVVLTNIEGPASTRFLAGARMTDVICWVPQAGLIGVGLALISYASQVQLALFVDQAIVADPERLMALTRHAFDELEGDTEAWLNEHRRDRQRDHQDENPREQQRLA